MPSAFPDELKIAKVIPLFKKGSKTDLTNYRPISILPSLSKVIEKLIYVRLNNFFDKHGILTQHQYGFRKKHSTEFAILDLQEKIASALENKQSAISIFLDLSKAFDCINHVILLKKLQYYGIRGLAFDLMVSYIKNRQQYVVVDNVSSAPINIHCGVPQGSILGPLLFLIYINDIVNTSDLIYFILFADDTNLFISDANTDNLYNIINVEMTKISLWFKVNKLKININKCCFIHFSNLNSNAKNIYLEGAPLCQVQNTKFLGVYIDQNLNWSAHIQCISNKLVKIVATVSKIKHLLPKSTLMQLYYTLVYPIITYGILAWGHADKVHLNKLSVLQNRFLYKISNSSWVTRSNSVYINLNCLKLSELVIAKCCIFVFKLKRNLLPGICNKYLVNLNKTIAMQLRSKEKLTHGYARIKCSHNSIKFLAPRVWNSLPKSLHEITTIAKFKKEIFNYLKKEYLSN